ncbi:hypothetical protein EYC80_004683 [Monilinia laxa]|uniref:Uncharacterized protein n=1 Tax=Monilinia laxa TaxID=61186 RepID=A0A5N6KHI8_MONLA|nr:hypothetical protein EYC80_004683 [Monilinia laxa]
MNPNANRLSPNGVNPRKSHPPANQTQRGQQIQVFDPPDQYKQQQRARPRMQDSFESWQQGYSRQQDHRQIHQQTNRQQKSSAERPVLPLCGNCSLIGHDLKRCIGPVNGFGVIDGCPMCNTKDHVLFECPKPWKSESNQGGVMIFGRNNKPMLSWPAELTAHSAWTSLRVELRPQIWTPSFALKYQLENPFYWREYKYASKWEDDSVIAQDPAWENPSSPIRLIDRSERGLNMSASRFGRPSVSQNSPPLQQYYQTPPYPAAVPATMPDSTTVSVIDTFNKLADSLLRFASSDNTHGQKQSAVKCTGEKDRSRSSTAKTETQAKPNKGKGKKNKYHQRSLLSAQDPSFESRMILQGRMDAPDLLPELVDNRNVKTKSDQASKNPAGDVVSDEELRDKSDVKVDDAALERKKDKRRRKQIRTRVRKRANNHAKMIAEAETNQRALNAAISIKADPDAIISNNSDPYNIQKPLPRF